MSDSVRLCAVLFALLVVGCSDDSSTEGDGGTGGTAATGGSAGSGGVAAMGGAPGTGGNGGTPASAGTNGAAGMGGSGGMISTVEPCTDDGQCGPEDDCVCPECDDDLFCSDGENCSDDGECNTFVEGCVCADCAELPVCER